MEDLYQLRQCWPWIFDLPAQRIAGWYKENVHQLRQRWLWTLNLPPGGSISTTPTLVVNFWPAAYSHRRMTHGGSISSAPTLLVSFNIPPGGSITTLPMLVLNFWSTSPKQRRITQGRCISTTLKSLVNIWPAAPKHPRMTHEKCTSTTQILVVNFELPPRGSILTSATLFVNFWPVAWRIYINLTNVSREFWPDAWRIYMNLANVDREPLTHRLEDQKQLHQRWSWIFDLPPATIGGWKSEDLYQLPPGGFISTSRTFGVNFWPAAPKHRRMIQRRCILTSPALFVNFWPAAWEIYINFLNVGREFLTCGTPRIRPRASTQWKMIH